MKVYLNGGRHPSKIKIRSFYENLRKKIANFMSSTPACPERILDRDNVINPHIYIINNDSYNMAVDIFQFTMSDLILRCGESNWILE